jgi:hypothetical protein
LIYRCTEVDEVVGRGDGGNLASRWRLIAIQLKTLGDDRRVEC